MNTKPSKIKKCSKHSEVEHRLYGIKRERWICVKCLKNQKEKQKESNYINPKTKAIRDLIQEAKKECYLCGYNKNSATLQFHHLDRNDKNFNIYWFRHKENNFDKIKKEIEKCIILCARCHQGVESGVLILFGEKNNIHQEYARSRPNSLSFDECKIHQNNSNKECKQCVSYNMYHHKINKYKKLLKCHGNKCYLCGFNDFTSGFQFHHTSPNNKSFAIGSKRNSYGFEKLLAETKKCVLLCANCHCEVESNKKIKLPTTTYSIHEHLKVQPEIILDNKKFLAEIFILLKTKKAITKILKLPTGTVKRKYKEAQLFNIYDAYEYLNLEPPIVYRKRNSKTTIIKSTCKQCDNEVYKENSLCVQCLNIFKRKVIRPPYKILKDDIASLGYLATGRKYGVSDNAIRKWVKVYQKELGIEEKIINQTFCKDPGKEVLVKYNKRGLSVKEIAVELDMSVNTVRKYCKKYNISF